MIDPRRLWTTQSAQQQVLVGCTAQLPGSQLTAANPELSHAVIFSAVQAMSALKPIQTAVANVRPVHAIALHQQGHHRRMRFAAGQTRATSAQLVVCVLA